MVIAVWAWLTGKFEAVTSVKWLLLGMALNDEKHLLPEEKYRKNTSTSCKAILGLVIAVPTVLFLGCAVAVVVLGVKLAASNSDSNVCTSPACVELASTVLRSMDLSVDPCQDFYNYSCGGWENVNVIPSGHGNWGVFNELDQRNNIAIRKLLQGNEDSDVKAIQLARQLYKSCLDTDGLTDDGATPIVTLLNETGGWNLIGLHNSKCILMYILLNIHEVFDSDSIDVSLKEMLL